MYFSQRLKVVEEYSKWIEETKEKTGISMKDCYENFLSFLGSNGYLKEENAQSSGECKPRDMIELPCINKADLSKFGQYTQSPAWFYQIVLRDIDGTIKVLEAGFDEEVAKRGLEEIKAVLSRGAGKQ